MSQLVSKTKQINRVYSLCWIVYCCSYFGRYNFQAAIADIVHQGLYTKPQMGVVGTVFFVVYGCGQLVNGVLGDRFSPYKMIFFGTFASSIANLMMCFAPSLPWLCVVWGVNGFAQSMLWAPIIYIVSNTMQGESLKKAEAWLAATMPAGTLSAYAVTTLVIRAGSWKTVFAIASVVLMTISLIWGGHALSLGKENRTIVPLHRQSENGAPKKSFFKVAAASGFAFMLLPVVLHAMLKDGVMTWVPTMIMELFNVTPSFSTMLTVVLPVLNFFGAVVVTVIYNRGKLSEARIACAFFAFTLLPLTALLFIRHYTPLVSVLFLAMITSAMCGINHIFLTLIPVCFAKEGRAATMAGVIDGIAYAGSALSTYGFGKIADSFGWSKMVVFWFAFAAVALAFCLLLINKWEQYRRDMMNSFFDAVLLEKDPMYDAAVITRDGVANWKNDSCNYCNNSHSVTKFFMASAVGILEMQGKLCRTDPVTSFFSPDELPLDYDRKWDQVTVEDALRHKTGIHTVLYGVDEDDDREKIGEDYLKYVFSLKIEEKTGEYRRYSDAAYYLIANIITKASGRNAERFLNENLFLPLRFRQWAMAKCPKGIPIGGGGFYARSDDIAKLGYVYACGGVYEGRRILPEQWIADAMEKDYACTQFRDTDVYVKTGAKGQMVAFSQRREAAVAWHGYSNDGNARNDRLLEAFVRYLDETQGKL